MARRQPLPRLWLMTDERIGEALARALHRLPRGGGVVFRHYATPAETRRALFERVRRIARRRGLIVVLAGTTREAVRWGADGVHNRKAGPHLLRTAAAHDSRELRRAKQRGADLVFLSPVFATRSHPGTRALGRYRFRALAEKAGMPIIALGGVDARRARSLEAYGWAGIDAWSGDQKRKVVPK